MSTLPLFPDHASPVFVGEVPKLRPQQSKAIQTLRERVRQNKKRILLVAPTSFGKMTVIAATIRTSSVPVLFVCHLRELIDQCCDQLARVGITNIGVIRGDDDRTNPNALVQVASIQTWSRREKPPAGIVFIDEAHRAVSDSYLALLEYYKQSIILGFTATPTRFDGRPLGNAFECLEVVATYEQQIKSGFIAEPFYFSGPMIPDLSSIRNIGGDYDDVPLGEIMRDQSLIGQSLDHWQRLAHLHHGKEGRATECPRRRTLVFAVNIPHSHDVCERFSAAGVRIAHLDGDTSGTERKRIIKAIGCGDLDAVTSVGVLLEGTDIPSVKCIVHLRPTQSIVLWRQSCGRSLRIWRPEGYTDHPSIQPLIIDHAGNMARHGPPHEDLHWELTERARPFEKKTPTRICSGCYAYLPAYRRLCPYCDTEAPPPQAVDLPKENEDQLQALAGTPEEMRRMYLHMMVQVARTKGYKPGFASARYKQRYGSWPPWEWSEAVKYSFASDPEWQANYAAHVKLKQKIDAMKMAKELAKIEEPEKEG
jgi:DNA repair protein RadD